MRRFTAYLAMTMVFLLGIMASCTKVGPMGPAGTDGTNGTDGTAGCITCHDDSQVILSKSLQYAASVHATGGNFERNTTDCAPCHTSQGFLETVANTPSGGERPQATAATIDNPAPPNCYTCHDIHSTYTSDDWSLTTSSPVVLFQSGTTVDFGKGNLCANCHQPRTPDPNPVMGGDSITVTSPYWGVHHGPQAGILGGAGGYEFGSGYSNSPHTNVPNGCVTCHMAEPYGTQSGGHQMSMGYAYHGHTVLNTAGCISCHPNTATLELKITALETQVEDLMTQLKNKLIDKGLLSTSDQPVPGKMSADDAGALMNYLYVEGDRSMGVHNPNYVITLLNNTLTALSKK